MTFFRGADGAFESKAPEQSGALLLRMRVRIVRTVARFRRFGRTRETAKAQHMNPPISPARHAQRHAERYRTCPSSMYANRTREGQEWKSVFGLNVVDGCIPSDLGTGTTAEIEEERRLLYVAMTRAKDDLHFAAMYRH